MWWPIVPSIVKTIALLKDLPTKWITRVPATLNEVKAALAQADPEQMIPLKAGYRG
jgi:hypothetical protein